MVDETAIITRKQRQ